MLFVSVHKSILFCKIYNMYLFTPVHCICNDIRSTSKCAFYYFFAHTPLKEVCYACYTYKFIFEVFNLKQKIVVQHIS